MLRSLIWKEWREQRAVALAGLCIAVVMPLLLLAGLAVGGADQRLEEVVTLLPIANWVLLWPFAAVATAAAALTPELRDARLGFLLSRPVPRRTILAIKFTVAALVAVAIIAAGQATAVGTALSFGVAWAGIPRTVYVNLTDENLLLTQGVVVFGLLCYALAAFLSLALRRAMQVVPVAALSAAALFAGNLLLWSNIDVVPLVGAHMTLWPASIAMFLIVATFGLFVRGELLRGTAHRRRVAVIGAFALLSWLALTGALAGWEMRPPSEDLVFGSLSGAPNGTVLAVAVARADRAASRTVGVVNHSGELEIIGRRLTTNPSLSADGRYLAYVGVAGRFGLRSNRQSLYVHDRLTGEERLLALISTTGPTGFDRPGVPLFSMDGRYVAANLHGQLVVADVDGERPSRTVGDGRDVAATQRCLLMGWDVTSGHVLQTCTSGVDRHVRWLDPDDGTELRRLAIEAGEKFVWALPRRTATLLVRSPVVRGGYVALDLATLSRQPLFAAGDAIERVEAGMTVDDDGAPADVVAYTKSLVGTLPERRQIRLRQLASGEDLLVAEHAASFIDLQLSPDGRRLFARMHGTEDGVAEVVVSQFVYDLDRGTSRQFHSEPVFWPGGWSAWMGGDRFAYLSDFPSRDVARSDRSLEQAALQGWSRKIRVVDFATGDEPVWPTH